MLSFLRFFLLFFLFWPVYAFLGGGGFAGMLVVCAPVALFYARPGQPVLRPYAVAGIAAVAWILITHSWSPMEAPLISGSLWTNNFAIKSGGARIALVAAAGALILMAVLQVAGRAGEKTRALIWLAFGLNAACAIVWSLYYAGLMNAAAGDLEQTKALSEGLQNALRNVNT